MFPRSGAATRELPFQAGVLIGLLLFPTACGDPAANDDPAAILADDSTDETPGDSDTATHGDGDATDGDPADSDPAGGDTANSDTGPGSPGDGDGAGGDEPTPPEDDPPPPLSRGLTWVRAHPMFISALTVAMGSPPSAFVDDYYDGFGANAVHLWADGLADAVTGWAAAGRGDFRYVSWTHADGTATNGQLMGGMSAPLAGRIGYQVGDEPGLGCEQEPEATCAVDSLRVMAGGIEVLRQRDPEALLYCNFAEVPHIEEVLTYYRDHVDADVVSYDFYDTGHESYRALERFRAAGLASGRPYWRYMRSFTFDGRADELPSAADLRWDAFSGALYGYTGHTWFLYTITTSPDLDPVFFTSEGDFTAARTETWSVVAQINRELALLGRALTQLTSTDVRYQPALSFRAPEGTRVWTSGAGGDRYLTGVAPKDNALLDVSVGFFRDERGEVYVMVQNPSHDSGEYPVSWTGRETIRLSFDLSAAPTGTARTHVVALEKTEGAPRAVPFTSRDGARATLDVTLDAGDVFFWKYDSGAPFVGY